MIDETFRFVDYGDQDFAIVTVTEEGTEGREIEPFADLKEVLDFIDEHPHAMFEIEQFGKVAIDSLNAEDARREMEQL